MLTVDLGFFETVRDAFEGFVSDVDGQRNTYAHSRGLKGRRECHRPVSRKGQSEVRRAVDNERATSRRNRLIDVQLDPVTVDDTNTKRLSSSRNGDRSVGFGGGKSAEA